MLHAPISSGGLQRVPASPAHGTTPFDDDETFMGRLGAATSHRDVLGHLDEMRTRIIAHRVNVEVAKVETHRDR